MKKGVIVLGAVFAAMSFASLTPLMAADEPVKQEKRASEFKQVRGATITKIEGQTVTVKGKVGDVKTAQTVTFTYTDKTEIVSNKKLYTEPLKVGDKITAKLNKEDVAVRIEVRTEQPKKNADGKKNAEGKDNAKGKNSPEGKNGPEGKKPAEAE